MTFSPQWGENDIFTHMRCECGIFTHMVVNNTNLTQVGENSEGVFADQGIKVVSPLRCHFLRALAVTSAVSKGTNYEFKMT